MARIPLHERGGLRLIAAEDADMFLETCLRNGIRVLGIEGFRLDRGATVPDMNAIADFSSLAGSDAVRLSVREAKQFFRAVARPGHLYDFALQERAAT